MSTFRPIERPAYPLAVAILLLAVFFCVSETRPRSVQMLIAFAALLLFAAPAEICAQASLPAAQVQQTQAAAPADAENPAEQAAPEPVKSASELYNSGLEQQQVEHDEEKARSFYERAIAASEKEPLVRASSYQNIGVISHLDARNSLQDAVDKLQAQDLNSAEKTVEEALTKLARAEDLYRESMRSAAADASVIRNQQILLADLKQAEQMKKQIEELKKLMEQARQQTQQAHDRQQQENQQDQQDQQQSGEQNQQQDQQQSGEQNRQQDRQQSGEQNQQQDRQQSGEQSGEQNQQQDQQQSAQDMTRQAEDTVSELEQKASEMNQESQKQAAQQAREELEKAREEQDQGNGEKAEEHLKNALDMLNRNQQDQQQSDDQQQDQQGDQGEQEQADQNGQESADQTPQPRQAEEQDARPDQGDMDKQQAEAILNMMSKDELDFKDANPSRRSSRLNNRVEKDW